MFSFTFRSVAARRRRLVGTLMAIVVGCGLLTGTLVLRDSVQTDLTQVFGAAHAGIDASVQGERTIGSLVAASRRPVEASAAEELVGLGEVEAVAAQIRGMARILDAEGNALGASGAPTLAASWVDDPDLRVWRLVEGGPPEEQGEVVIDAETAAAAGLTVGDRAVVLVPERLEVRIVGLVDLAGEAHPGGATVALFTQADAATHLTEGPGLVTRILVEAAPGTSHAELISALESAAPADAVVLDRQALVEEAVGEVGDASGEVLADILLAVAGVAVIVALIGIHNTFSITVAQRTGETALLRTLGASRIQIVSSVLVEGALLGIVASLVGLAAGVLLTAAAGWVFGSIGQSIYTGLPHIKPATLGIAFAVGVGGTIFGTLPPALRSSRVTPIQAFIETTLEAKTSVGRMVAGILLGAAGVAATVMAVLGASDPYLLLGAGAIGVLAGVVALSPSAVRPVSAMVGPPLKRWLGFTGRLARLNAERSPRRTAGSATALMVGLALVSMLAVVGGSVHTSMERIVENTFKTDFVVLSSGFSGSGLSPEIEEHLAATPEIETAVGLGLGAALVDGEERVFTVTDPDLLAKVMTLDTTEGSLSSVGDDGIAVSAHHAEESGWEMGTQVPLEFLDGTSTLLTVEAIYQTHAGDALSTSIVPEAVWNRHAPQRTHTAVFIDLAEDVGSAAGRAAAEETVAAYGAPTILDQTAYVDQQLGGIRQLLALVYGLLALSVLIASMGISNTLSLAVHERTRELGILRAVGQSRRQTRTMIAAESTIISILGTATGMGAGIFLGWGLITALSDQIGIGTFDVPIGQLTLMALLGTIIGAVSALRPANRAATIPPSAAMAAE